VYLADLDITLGQGAFGKVVRAEAVVILDAVDDIILVFHSPTAVANFQGEPISGGVKYKRYRENLANIAIYLGNGIRYRL